MTKHLKIYTREFNQAKRYIKPVQNTETSIYRDNQKRLHYLSNETIICMEMLAFMKEILLLRRNY